MTRRIQNRNPQPARLTESTELRRQVEEVVNWTPVIDVHTHLYATQFGEMSLFGIDDLLTYHYLIAETFRSTDISPERFWQMTKTKQADLIWKTLFVENTPLSEATCGVVTALTAFDLDPDAPDLSEARAYFKSRNPSEHINRVLDMARVSDVVMTNDPLDSREASIWESGVKIDPRFHAALRMDRLLNDWNNAASKLSSFGYNVSPDMSGKSASEVRRFLDRWIVRMKPLYMAVSLPDDFKYPDTNMRDRVIQDVVIPTALEHKLPFAVMVGVRRGVNPALRGAGDGVGKADMTALEHLCVENPDVRFLATFLSRENQHELCVAARKFSNLMPFGCWWFLNNPSIVSEVTTERLELLGTSFIPQHSDARILEQVVYKWEHSRRTIAKVLFESYDRLRQAGRAISRSDIERDVTRMFSGNFRKWVGLEQTDTEHQLTRISDYGPTGS
jgi:hypothetical protein